MIRAERRLRIRSGALVSTGLVLICGVPGIAWADQIPTAAASPSPAATAPAAASHQLQDIVVTARKRNETSIAVPLTVTAIGGPELSRRGLNTLEEIAKVVPGLTIGAGSGGSSSGGAIILRGIAGPSSNVLGDQAVSFNLDGVAIARGTIRQLGAFDIDQLEVLKGPQALFFGKNSPGGVISMRSADPTSTFKAKVSVGYEGVGHEVRADGFVSGPITDSLGVRVAAYYSNVRGWVKNTFPAGYDISPKDRWGPGSNEFDIRGTLKFDNGGPFSGRLKVSAGRHNDAGPYANSQYIHCSNNGKIAYDSLLVPGSTYDCVANDKTYFAGVPESFGKYNPLFNHGSQTRLRQQLASLELNYNVTDKIKLTSVTGYYHAYFDGVDQFNYSIDTLLLPAAGVFKDKEVSEEIRLGSSFDGPLNFTVGGLYSSTRSSIQQQTLFGTNPPATNFFGAPSPSEFNEYDFYQHGQAYSFFGQLSWKIIPTVELSAGGRYSHESKSLPLVETDFSGNPYVGSATPNNTIAPISFTNFSPEATISWRPTSRLNIFMNYKQGFLSGGYNGSSDVLVPGQFSNSPYYGPEKVRGFEGGIKAGLLNNTLRINVSGFMYKALGLQVASYQQGFSTIRNAGKVDIKGVEGDFRWRPSISGLEFHGAFAYTRSIYQQYLAPCYVGQTQALGCTINLYGSALPQTQNLAGTQVPNAPFWVLSGGITYDVQIGSNLKLGLSSDVNFNTSAVTDSKNTPFSRSPKQALLDATVRLGSVNNRWEVALIGRNLTNRFYWSDSQGNFPSGAGTGGGPGTVSVLEDRTAQISRGRELWVRLTLSYG